MKPKGSKGSNSLGTYPGGKAGAGVFHTIARQIPPHATFIEGFAGHAALSRFLKPCGHSFLVGNDPNVCEWLETNIVPKIDNCRVVTAAASH